MLRSTAPFRFSAASSSSSSIFRTFASKTRIFSSPCSSSTFFCASSSAASWNYNNRGFHSLALEQAMRITTPSPRHPATGASDPAGSTEVTARPADPAVVWREHWDVEFERPYYHNLVTNEVRTTLPEGFPTRFLFYFQRNKGGLVHEESDAGKAPAHATRAKTMKERIKDYGMAGLLLYGVIHFGMLGIIFTVMMAGVDVRGLLKSIGIDIGNRLKGDNSLMAVWLVAILVNKVFVPLQLIATLSLAPKVSPYLKNFLIRLGFRA